MANDLFNEAEDETYVQTFFFSSSSNALIAVGHPPQRGKKTKQNPNAKMSLDLLDPTADEHNEA